MDKISKEARSRVMARVRSKETQLEKSLRLELWDDGIRYRKNSSEYFGKPDLVFKGKKTSVFIDSCFWHGCIYHLRMPSSNRTYWENKIERNRKRDMEVNNFYKIHGWKVIRVWEHELNNLEDAIDKIKKTLNLS